MKLAAGVTGGLFCLATVYGTADWPTAALQSRLSETALVASFALAVLLVYAGYWSWIHYQSATMDLSRRRSA